MERLTIKEIAVYVPFKLQWKFEGSDEVHELMGIDITDFGVHLFSPYGDYGKCRIYEGKPLLRPLSQLTEEIEHNGERFVPIIELAKMFHIPGKYAVTHYGDIKDYGYVGIKVNCYVENSNSRYSEFSIHSDELILHNDYRIVQKLHEWHFDTANLLGRNLALPIDGKEVEGCQ